MSDTEVAAQESTSPVETLSGNGAKRGRGRPKKEPKEVKKSAEKVTNNGVSNVLQTNGTNGSEIEESTLPKKRGRKPKAEKPNKELKTNNTLVATTAAKRGRGRPKKSVTSSAAKKGPKRANKKSSRSDSVEDEAEPNDDNTGDEDLEEEDDE